MNVTRAWKDPEYRATLTETELAMLPAHPCGAVELGDEELARVAGVGTEGWLSLGCCGGVFSLSNNCTTGQATCALDCGTQDGLSTCGPCTA